MPNLTTSLDLVEKLLKVGAPFAILFLVLTGFTHKWGAAWGKTVREGVRSREGKPNLQTLPDDDKPTMFWSDARLIRGGLSGLAGMAVLLCYVGWMLALHPPAKDELPQMVSRLLGYPNTMAGLFTLVNLLPHRKSAGSFQWFLVAGSIAGALAALSMAGRDVWIGWQWVLLVPQALAVSYTTGVGAGIRSAEYEGRCPLVEVETATRTITGLRMLRTGETECRFVDSTGAEVLIPKREIRSIRVAAEGAPMQAKAAPGSI